MVSNVSNVSIIDVPRERLEEAVDVLTRAFEDDPLMRYLFAASDESPEICRRELMRFSCLVRLELGWPLLGAEQDGRLLGVLGVTMPGEAQWPEALNQAYRRVGDVAGAEALRRLEGYSRLADSGRPKEPHYHVGVVGVLPEAQGKGAGTALLDYVHAMADGDADSVGVALDTETAANRRFYEGRGYLVVEEHEFEGLTIYCMFRPR